jgi:hypothetical protein
MPTPKIGYTRAPELVQHAVFVGKVVSVCDRTMTTLTSDDWPCFGGAPLCEDCCHRLGPGAPSWEAERHKRA